MTVLKTQEMTADGDAAWPGGIRQQFLAARPMVEALLRRLKREPSLEVRPYAAWVVTPPLWTTWFIASCCY